MFHPASARTRQRFLAAPALLLLLACGGGGGESHLTPPATADFALQLSPANLQIPAGGSGFVMVTLSRLNGFTSAVTLSGAGFPAGVVAEDTIPAGSSSLQLPVAIAPGVTTSSYSGLSIRGQAGSLRHDAPFGLTVAPALAASHLRNDLVQAAGGRQTNGSIENHAVAREDMSAQLVKDANDSTRVRQAFLPSGTPTDH
jgi:hypothetical protein